MLDELDAGLAGCGALFLEPRDVFDAAIIGVVKAVDGGQVVAYDPEIVMQALMAQDGWDEDTAREWYNFNIAGAYAGPGAPVFIGPDQEA